MWRFLSTAKDKMQITTWPPFPDYDVTHSWSFRISSSPSLIYCTCNVPTATRPPHASEQDGWNSCVCVCVCVCVHVCAVHQAVHKNINSNCYHIHTNNGEEVATNSCTPFIIVVLTGLTEALLLCTLGCVNW